MTLLEGGFSDADILAQVRDFEPAVALIAERVMLAGGDALQGGAKCGVVASVITGFLLLGMVVAAYHAPYVKPLMMQLFAFLRWASFGYVDITGVLTSLSEHASHAWNAAAAASAWVGAKAAAASAYVFGTGSAIAPEVVRNVTADLSVAETLANATIGNEVTNSTLPGLGSSIEGLADWALRVWEMAKVLFGNLAQMLGESAASARAWFTLKNSTGVALTSLSYLFAALKLQKLVQLFSILSQYVCDALWGKETEEEKLAKVAAQALVYAQEKEIEEFMKKRLGVRFQLPSERLSARREPSPRRSGRPSERRSGRPSGRREPSESRGELAYIPKVRRTERRESEYVEQRPFALRTIRPNLWPAEDRAAVREAQAEVFKMREEHAGEARLERAREALHEAIDEAQDHATLSERRPQRGAQKAPASPAKRSPARKPSPAKKPSSKSPPKKPSSKSPPKKPSPKRSPAKKPSPAKKTPARKRKSPAPKKPSPAKKTPTRKAAKRKSPKAPTKHAGDARVAAARKAKSPKRARK